MATLQELNRIVNENRAIINRINSEAKTINQVDNIANLTTDDYVLIFDNQGNLTGKGTIQQVLSLFTQQSLYVVVQNAEFRLLKKPGNTGPSIELGDVIRDGYISSSIIINQAIYTNALGDGDTNNIGTQANDFTDGNYAQVEISELT